MSANKHRNPAQNIVASIALAMLVILQATPASGQTITEIIDVLGDGAGNGLDGPEGIAVDAAGNAYVTGFSNDNAFRITPAGVIAKIIDLTGDSAGHGLNGPAGITVDTAGNAYVTGEFSENAFKIAASAADCNTNGIPDECDIAGGTSKDCQFNQTPDECETDDDLDGVPNDCDVCPCTPFSGTGVDEAGRPRADLDRNCLVNLFDFSTFAIQFGTTACPVPSR